MTIKKIILSDLLNYSKNLALTNEKTNTQTPPSIKNSPKLQKTLNAQHLSQCRQNERRVSN